MALSHFRRLFLVWALTAMVAAVQAGTGLAAEKNGATAQVSPVDALAKALAAPLSATEFFTMAPFIVPVINKGRHDRQLVLVVAITLEDENDRVEIRRLSAKIRNEIYELLFKMVTFRTITPRIPRKSILESRLTRAAQRVAGDEIIKTIVVHVSQVTSVR